MGDIRLETLSDYVITLCLLLVFVPVMVVVRGTLEVLYLPVRAYSVAGRAYQGVRRAGHLLRGTRPYDLRLEAQERARSDANRIAYEEGLTPLEERERMLRWTPPATWFERKEWR